MLANSFVFAFPDCVSHGLPDEFSALPLAAGATLFSARKSRSSSWINIDGIDHNYIMEAYRATHDSGVAFTKPGVDRMWTETRSPSTFDRIAWVPERLRRRHKFDWYFGHERLQPSRAILHAALF